LVLSYFIVYNQRQFYGKYYDEMKLLNPEFSLLLRTTENAMPAITTELEFTTNHVLQFMIQTGRFRNINGTIASHRVDAALEYMKFDWDLFLKERFSIPNFDPEHPAVDVVDPGWRTNEQIQKQIANYMSMKKHQEELMDIIKAGPNNEYERSENALLMCQRVDLWCAGPKEVEQAVIHLYKLGRALNEREVELPSFIADFIPGTDDMADS
jgi:hypothetical protein